MVYCCYTFTLLQHHFNITSTSLQQQAISGCGMLVEGVFYCRFGSNGEGSLCMFSIAYLHRMKYHLILLLLVSGRLGAQPRATVSASPIDVQHYRFGLTLSDRSDTIDGMASVTLLTGQQLSTITLNLAGINPEGKGMRVVRVMDGEAATGFNHRGDLLLVQLKQAVAAGVTKTLHIEYRGIPADGLVISKSIFNRRTFFGDNWPNRARQWLPCNDIPSDKASVEFIVTAPQHYGVVSNGLKKEETLLPDSMKRTHWEETQLLPTKVMVIGAADFSVADAGMVNNIPVTSWIYEELKDKGFADYAAAPRILQYFIGYIGPYGYKKLANVQSKTIFGGMENASAIFYFEQSVTGQSNVEDLMAHEIAHQWFGNMVTERAFNDLWLSEGFATYLTDVYLESRYGTDSMNRRLQGERNGVVAFAKASDKPVVDTTSDYMSLLNQNSYQKGAWILHMLRRTTGDVAFQRTLRSYYAKYQGGNASSEDFMAVAEAESGKKLGAFFKQWLHQPGVPRLKHSWAYNASKKGVVLEVEQVQPVLFSFPLDIAIEAGEKKIARTFTISRRKTKVVIPVGAVVKGVTLDPNTNLLWEAVVEEK